MIAEIDAFVSKCPDANRDWEAWSNRDGFIHLSTAAAFGARGHSWAANYAIGQLFDTRYMLTLTPLEVRNVPVVIFEDDSHLTDVAISLTATHMPHCVFPPSNPDLRVAPLFMLHRGNHYTHLRSGSDADGWSYYNAILQHMPHEAVQRYIPSIVQDVTLPMIPHILGITSTRSDVDSLRNAHSTLLKTLKERYGTELPPSLQQLDQQSEVIDGDDEVVDLTSTHPSPRRTERDRGSPDHTSPTKAAAISTPPRNHGLERTPRNPTGLSPPTSPTEHSPVNSGGPLPPPSLSTQASQLSLHSDVDMGAYVDMHCGKHESIYAGRVGVRDAASSDETSETGSLPPSSRSASLSQTPSMYSTGSLHEHQIPRGADTPQCTCRRAMIFVRFTQQNHACDNTGCSKPIARNAYGWHCADCDVDVCSICFPHSWTPEDSFTSSVPDSSSTLALESPPPSDHGQAAPRLQGGDGAAAFGRGHDA